MRTFGQRDVAEGDVADGAASPLCVHPSYCGDADHAFMTEQQGRRGTDANDVTQGQPRVAGSVWVFT